MNTRNARLLIVDDELHMRESLARWFLEDGYEVETAGDAKAALALLGRQTFDAIITDIRMPGMDGLELLKQIKEVNPTPPSSSSPLTLRWLPRWKRLRPALTTTW
jgi:CheY-like chemotaxis protein